MSQKTRLMRTYENIDPKTFEDKLYIFALNIEDAMLTGGAVPNKDYKILDLYQMAMPVIPIDAGQIQREQMNQFLTK